MFQRKRQGLIFLLAAISDAKLTRALFPPVLLWLPQQVSQTGATKLDLSGILVLLNVDFANNVVS